MAAVRLDDISIDAALADLDGWARDGDAITKRFVAKSFPDAIAFITRMAFDAERLNHHPELQNVWAKVDVRLTTHDAGGITALDVELAGCIDAVAPR